MRFQSALREILEGFQTGLESCQGFREVSDFGSGMVSEGFKRVLEAVKCDLPYDLTRTKGV